MEIRLGAIAPRIQYEKELQAKFSKGYKVLKPYLRLTLQPNK